MTSSVISYNVITKLKLIDLKGQTLAESDSNRLNTSFLNTGIYVVVIFMPDGIQVRRIIKN